MKPYQADNDRWEAVVQRQAAADGSFFYAVKSTGIYCYPSCPSRLAKRENVLFYTLAAQAISDGFVACKRCRSDLAPLSERQRETVIRACRLLSDVWADGRVDSVAASLNISRYHLQKLFRKYLGISPKTYAQAIRNEQLNIAMDSSASVTQALYDAGYDNPSTFYQSVTTRLGMTARQRQGGAPGLDIRYGFAATRYGQIVVAATAQGVCAVLFGPCREDLVADLTQRFPNAHRLEASDTLEGIIEQVVRQIDQPDISTRIPLDIQGTVFQEKVWAALRESVRGETMSYAQLASAVGQPKAARAVASACAANPVAVLIPCHRVIRGDGSLSGYRWGLERKAQLLADESRQADESE